MIFKVRDISENKVTINYTTMTSDETQSITVSSNDLSKEIEKLQSQRCIIKSVSRGTV